MTSVEKKKSAVGGIVPFFLGQDDLIFYFASYVLSSIILATHYASD